MDIRHTVIWKTTCPNSEGRLPLQFSLLDITAILSGFVFDCELHEDCSYRYKVQP